MRNPVVIERAERLHQIPLNRPLEHSRYLRRLAARGIEPIDLTTGFTDPPPRQDAIVRTSDSESATGGRSGPGGLEVPAESSRLTGAEFRRAFSNWFAYRFDVEIDPDRHVLPFAGSAVGPACVAMALVNPGETVLANGQIQSYPLHGRND
ncbi:MAG: hypothetical protein F4132_01595, partial [Gemmatimonadetes bacterium]|nr:hypothetical protein [Gemmatimonadota bacterium]